MKIPRKISHGINKFSGDDKADDEGANVGDTVILKNADNSAGEFLRPPSTGFVILRHPFDTTFVITKSLL